MEFEEGAENKPKMLRNQSNKTDKQKFELCQYARDNKAALEAYVNWIKVKWNVTVHKSTVSRILKDSHKRLNEDIANPDSKRHKSVKFPELERALMEFILTYQHRTILSDAIIIAKAKLFAERLQIPESKLQFSSGWLQKFKERNGIQLRKLHGEASSSDQNAIIENLPSLREKLSRFPLDRIYNMDETGLFYRLEPDRSLATTRLSGRKKNKERLSIALCANADGSHKLNPLVIGKYAKPRCFKNVNFNSLRVTYRNNNSAWMLTTLFQEWLSNFDIEISKLHGGQPVLLILDNCPSHVAEGVSLSNVEIHFLPPNTTAKIQPMDAGIIMSFKKHYRRYHIQWMLEQIESGEDAKNLKMSTLLAIQYIIQAWDDVTSDVISNCWKATKILPDNVSCGDEAQALDNELLTELSESIVRLSFPEAMTTNEYLSFPQEDIVFELSESDDIISLFSGEHDDETDDDSNEIPIVSANEALKNLENIKTFLIQQEGTSSYLKAANNLEKFIREKRVNLMKQSSITQFLVNN